MEEITNKVRMAIEDFGEDEFRDHFVYNGEDTFVLSEPNINEIKRVYINGSPTENYYFDSDFGELTIESGVSLSDEDNILIRYTYFEYSENEINGYMTSAINKISVHTPGGEFDFEVEDGDIFPTPNNREEDLIAFVTAIIINPNYDSYRTDVLSVSYPKEMSKDKKIKRTIQEFYYGTGSTGIIFKGDYNE